LDKSTSRSEESLALRKGEEFFRTLIENSTDVITILDTEGVVHYQSPSLQRIFGYKPEELLGKNAFSFVHPEDLNGVVSAFQETIKNQAVSSPVVRFRFRHREGSWIYLEAVGRIIKNDEGGLQYVINSRDVTERVRMESDLRALSLSDELTGLRNRRAFEVLAEQEIAKTKRAKTDSLYFIFADMDDFKAVNDGFGHAEGDKALMAAAKILRKTFRGVDIVARIGGDEFVVLVTGADEDNLQVILKRLRDNIQAWNSAKESSYTLSMSIGVARYNAEKLNTVEALLSQADRLMYEQKKQKPGKEIR